MTITQRIERTLLHLTNVDKMLATSIEILNSFAHNQALDSDKRLEAFPPRPLEGIPFTVKDVIDIAGIRTTGGSTTRHHHTPAAHSAEVIVRLLSSGAIPIAKDSTSEFAIGDMHTPLKGPCRNPWDPARWAGGSSSGTAVSVATGIVPFGIGTDVNGSIRMPAAFCGVVGLKPTRGLLPMNGILRMASSTEVVGPIAKYAKTLHSVLPVLKNTSALKSQAGDSPTFLPRDIRLAVPHPSVFSNCDNSVIEGMNDFLELIETQGGTIFTPSLPDMTYAPVAARLIVAAEAAYEHCHEPNAWHEYSAFTRQRLEYGRAISATDYIRGQQYSRALGKKLRRILDQVDAIVLPTVPGTAPRISDAIMTINDTEVETYQRQSEFVSICSITGFPAISFPTGFDQSGLPVSTMLIGAPRQEERLISIVDTYQAQRPPTTPSNSSNEKTE